MSEPKTRHVAKTAEGLDHFNTLAEEVSTVNKFAILSVQVRTAHPVEIVMEDDPKLTAWETRHWEGRGERRKLHYDRNAPADEEPTDDVYTAIVHTRGEVMNVDIEVAFLPKGARLREEVAFSLSIPELGFQVNKPAVPLRNLTDWYTFEVGPLGRRVEARRISMILAAAVSGVELSRDRRTVDLDGFELMTVVARPIGTMGIGEYAPLDAGVTQKRLRASIEHAGGPVGTAAVLDLHGITEKLVNVASALLERHPDAPLAYAHPVFNNLVGGAWCILANARHGGECQAIVRVAMHMMWQLGIQGPFERRNVWAEPHPTTYEGNKPVFSGEIVYDEKPGDEGGVPKTHWPEPVNGHRDCYLGLLQGYVKEGMELSESNKPPIATRHAFA